MSYEVGHIRTDSGRFLDKGNYAVDPGHPDFAGGAKGDWNGTTGTDDTVALGLALSHAGTTGGGVVRGRTGHVYKITGRLTVPANVVLEDISLHRVGAGFDAVYASTVSGVAIRNVTITGDAAATGTSGTDRGIALVSCTDSEVIGCTVSGQPREGIEASGAGTARLKIRGNTITDCYGHGIAVTQQFDIDVSHNTVHDLLDAGSVGLALGYSGVTLTRMVCVGNIVRNCPGKGMGLNNLIGAVIQGNTITDCGLMITANSLQDCIISGNVGRTFTPGADFQAAINLNGCTNNVVESNRIEGVTTYDGIRVIVSSTGNVLQGNRISGAGARGIYVESNSNTIHDNDIRGSGGRGITLWGCGYTDVKGNRLEGNAGGGILLGNDPAFSQIHHNEISNVAAAGTNPPAIELADLTTRSRVLNNVIHNIGTGAFIKLGTGLSDVVAIHEDWGDNIPTTGTYNKGDRRRNSDPDAGETAEWVCTVGGTPGTWKVVSTIAV